MSVKIEKVVTNRFEMEYFKFGEGEKKAVIISGLSVKSIMGSAESVVSAYKAMQKDYTVYVFDRRRNCPDNYTIYDMADDTAEAFDCLGIKNAYVFGVSQGGMIAQCIAVKRPDLVCKLALCSTVPRITQENYDVIKSWIEIAERRDESALNKRIFESIFSESFCEKFGDFALQMMSGVSEYDFNRFIILARGCSGFDVYNELESIKCPVYVVGTKADKVFDVNYSVLIAEKTKAELYLYDDYGHAVYDEAPDFTDRLIKFFESD